MLLMLNVHKEKRCFMNKTVICNIPMKEKVDLVVYTSDDKSIPASDRPVRYPINSFLEKTLKPEDQLKVILVAKNDTYSYAAQNTEAFKRELEVANENAQAKIEYVLINTDFSEERIVHEKLIGQLIDEIDEGTHILVDMTYGPKDLPIVIFTALNFAEKFLDCSIDNILYGQASFENGHALNTKLCDMSPLYYLGSLVHTIKAVKPSKSLLKTLLSL